MIKQTTWIFPLVGLMLVSIDMPEVLAEEIEKPKETLLEDVRSDDELLVDEELQEGKITEEVVTVELTKSNLDIELPKEELQETPQNNPDLDKIQEMPKEELQETPQNNPDLDKIQEMPKEELQKTPQNNPDLDNTQEMPQVESQDPQKNNPDLDNTQEIPQVESQDPPQNNPDLDNTQEIPQVKPQESQKEPPQEKAVNETETTVLESISVTPPKTDAKVGDTLGRLEVFYTPGNAVKPKWEYWWSTDTSVATVNAATGVITVLRAGTTTIMVEVDTGQEAGAELTIKDETSTPVEEEALKTITVTPPKTDAKIGDTVGRLEVVYTPGNAVKPKWEYWWSTDTSVATVNAATGVITVLRAGTTTIMVEVDTGQEAGAELTVKDETSTPVEEEALKTITVTPPKTDAKVGDTLGRLEVVYTPGNAVKPKWEYWWSTDTSVATVNAATGAITILRAGTTMIMVEVDTGQEAGALLTVSDDSSTPIEKPLESISIDSSRTNLEVGETIGRLDLVYNPGNAIKPKWEYWWSLNPDIATVDSATGIITTIRDGKVTIMVEVDTGQVASKKFVVGVIAENGPNSQIFLPLPTEYDDGTDWPGRKNQATHPSVIQFETNWNGYKYWMGFTPYPYGDDQKENPSVVASHDGINWVVPGNISNPVVPIDIENAYNSDTHMVYNSTTNELELWYRQVQLSTYTETLFRIKTTDAINWTIPEAMVSTSSNNLLQYISPSIIYENGKYKMWFNRNWEVHYAESLDGKNWNEAIKINTAGQNMHTWHPNVQKFNDTYYLLNNDNDTNAGVRGVIRYSTSSDGINFTEETFILSYTDDGESYDSAGVYRASMAVGEHGVYLYYGQISNSGQWTIGMSIGADLGSLVGLDEETLAGFTRV